jgi:DNA processing protein
MNTRTIRPTDPEWPARLNELGPERPPARLFLEGLRLCGEDCAVAVVGSRRPTAAGVQVAQEITRGLAEAGFAVVSGLAVGIDTVAHRAALDAGGYTIAVLGCGLDVNYPTRNAALKRNIASVGTLVSEYEAGVEPQPYHFPARNRIIAGLATAVVFVEGSERSGGLITARQALDSNRHVFAVPGSVRNPLAAGPNELIRTSQATLVTDAQQILEELAPGLVWGGIAGGGPPVGQPSMNPKEARVLLFLDDAPVALDRVCTDLGLTLGEAAIALAALEVRNYVAKRPGGYVVTDAGARVRTSLPLEEADRRAAL